MRKRDQITKLKAEIALFERNEMTLYNQLAAVRVERDNLAVRVADLEYDLTQATNSVTNINNATPEPKAEVKKKAAAAPRRSRAVSTTKPTKSVLR